MLTNDKLSLRKQLEAVERNGGGAGVAGGVPQAEHAETNKRLKKRELECQALWDTLKDLK